MLLPPTSAACVSLLVRCGCCEHLARAARVCACKPTCRHVARGQHGDVRANSSISAMRPPYYLLEGIVILGVIYGSLVWRVCNPAAPAAPAGPRGIPGLSPGCIRQTRSSASAATTGSPPRSTKEIYDQRNAPCAISRKLQSVYIRSATFVFLHVHGFRGCVHFWAGITNLRQANVIGSRMSGR